MFRRVGPDGQPFDAFFTKRSLDVLGKLAPFRARCWFIERELNKNFDHKAYGLKPKHRVMSQHPTINDALPNKLLSGTVILREDVKCFTETGVIFQNDEKQVDVDAVVFATGYKLHFPFVSEDIVQVKDNKVQLYKYIFPPHLPHPTLAAINCVQVVGAVFPIAEAQARWYALVVNGKRKLPSKEAMLKDIADKESALSRRYVSSTRHTVQVDYIPYLDELADEIGCKPNFLKMLFTDPKVFWTLFHGPSIPYQYRLKGPHEWSGAREAILTSHKRTMEALKTRKCGASNNK